MDSPAGKGDAMLLKELEHLRQELYTALRHKEALTATVSHLESENTDLKNAVTQETQKRKDSQSQDQTKMEQMYRQQIADLRQCMEEAQGSELEAKKYVQELEQRLKHMIETAPSAAPQTVDNDEELATLQLSIAKLENEKDSLKANLLDAAAELQRKAEENTRLKQELAEKEEEVECLESQFSTQCNISERLREETYALRAQLEAEDGQVDTKKKGNSLFSEVDDRRVAAEQKLVNMECLLREAEEKLIKEQKENKRLKNQVLLLRQTASKGYDEEMVKTLQRQLEESKRSVIHLTEELQKRKSSSKQKSTQEFVIPSLDNVMESNKQYINLLQTVIKNQKKDIETAKAEAQSTHLQLLRTELRLTEAKNEIMTLTHERERQKGMTSHLTLALQEMRRKYEPENTEAPSKTKIKITGDGPDNLHSLNSDSKCVLKASTTQDNVKQQTMSESGDKKLVGTVSDITGDAKENLPSELIGAVQEAKRSKSVRMMSQVNTVSSGGEVGTTDLRADGRGRKLKKTSGGTGKFQSVTYQDVETQPAECKQQ